MKWSAISEQELAAAGELEAAYPVTVGGPSAMRVVRPQANRVVAPSLSATALRTKKASRSIEAGFGVSIEAGCAKT